MKQMFWRFVISSSILLLVGCTPLSLARPDLGANRSSHGGPVRDHVSLVDYLHAHQYQVAIVGDVQQPFLHARGTRFELSGGAITTPAEVQSFNYDDTDLGGNGQAIAAQDAATIQPDGTLQTMMISWQDVPHFFHRERVIVLYVGSNQIVLQTLTAALGPQFAGR